MKGGKMVNGSNGKLDLLSNCAFFFYKICYQKYSENIM